MNLRLYMNKRYRILHIPSATFVSFTLLDLNETCSEGVPRKMFFDNTCYMHGNSDWIEARSEVIRYDTFFPCNSTKHRYKLNYILKYGMPFDISEFEIMEFIT